MLPVAIEATGWCLPPNRVAVDELPELAGMAAPERQLCAALGINQVPVDDADSRTLAIRAARQALAEAGREASDVDALILIEPRVPQNLLVSEATAVQAALGSSRALTFSVGGLGCASIASALLTARGLLGADPQLKTVLVTHGSKPPTSNRYRHPVTVQGDCGVAVVLSRRGPVSILDVVLESDGDYAELFRVDYQDNPVSEWREECTDLDKYSLQLALHTRERLRAVNRRLLDRQGLRQSDIAGYLCQNLSVAALSFYQEALGVTIESDCAHNLRHHGHLGPADTLLNLHTSLRRDRWCAGDRVVLLNVSPAAAWSATLVEINSRGTEADVHL